MPRLKQYYCARVPLTRLENTTRDVCKAIGFPERDIRLRATNGPSVQARQIVTWVLRRVTRVPFPQLGAFVGKDHTSLLHADQKWCQKLAAAKGTNPGLRQEMAQLTRAIRAAHRERMAGKRPAPVKWLDLAQLLYAGRDLVRAKNGALFRTNPVDVAPEIGEPLSSVAWHDEHYNGTARGFFKRQNDRAMEHMRKALAQEQKERLAK